MSSSCSHPTPRSFTSEQPLSRNHVLTFVVLPCANIRGVIHRNVAEAHHLQWQGRSDVGKVRGQCCKAHASKAVRRQEAVLGSLSMQQKG
eukprot:4176617-Amphidinium_carterae.1